MRVINRVYLILFLICLSSVVCAQRFRAGLGISYNEQIFNRSLVYVDTLVVFEGNLNSSDPFILPYIGYRLLDSKRIDLNIGFQYHSGNGISIFVNDRRSPIPYRSGKTKGVYRANIEMPIMIDFKVVDFKGLTLNLVGGLVPVWSIPNPKLINYVPEVGSWTQEIVDALNAAETIPKSFYVNYSFGLALEYGRFGTYFSRYHNLQRSISKGYTLYGTTYPFQRRISSSRFGMYYRFDIGKKDKNKPSPN